MNISSRKGIYVFDTNVPMHDPTCLFHFHEHDIVIPMKVLEELDHNKTGFSEVARNARQFMRFLNDLLVGADAEAIENGLRLPAPNNNDANDDEPAVGRLFFQTEKLSSSTPENLDGNIPDNNILGVILALKEEHTSVEVTLVTKDINLRIKAAVLGIRAEDYRNDKVLDDVNLLYRGHLELAANFWDEHSKKLESWQEEGRSFYRVTGADFESWHVSQCLTMAGDPAFQAIVRELDSGSAVFELLEDYHNPKHSVWGINARNKEQNFALNMLLDQELDFVSLLGIAGTGKTLLTLAAGLAQVLDQNIYHEIIMTRATVPVGDDIGFLPGTEEEKMAPWMGALKDNLEVLTQTEGGEWGRAATDDLLRNRIRIHSLNFMRGRTFLKKYIIIDEAQNLTAKQMKTLVTRAGPGTKIVCLGNIGQIDTPYLTETTSGLTFAVDRFKNWPHSGHITLIQGERSRLADFASENL